MANLEFILEQHIGYPPLPARGGASSAGSFYGPPGGYGAPSPVQPRADDKGAAQPSRSLWLGNVHPDTTEHELRGAFQEFGPIENIKVPPSLLLPQMLGEDRANRGFNALDCTSQKLRFPQLYGCGICHKCV